MNSSVGNSRNELPQARIFAVSGSSGFIGNSLLRALPQRGCEGVPLPRIRRGGGAELQRNIPRGAVVVHLAARTSSDFSTAGAVEECVENNVLGTLTLMEAAAAAGASQVVLLSGNFYRPGEESRSESDEVYIPEYASIYIGSKLLAEKVAIDSATRSGIGLISLRVGAVYGPGMRSESFLPRFIRAIKQREKFDVHSEGKFSADFVFIDDVTSAIIEAGLRGCRGTLNVGSGESVSVRQIVHLLLEYAGASEALANYKPSEEGRIGNFPALNIERLRAELGLHPRVVRSGLKDYLARFS